MNNLICCIIVTYNCKDEFIIGFKKIIPQVNKIVIVDNGSNNETIEILKKLKEQYDIEVIYNKQNVGIAKALNQGIEYAVNYNYNWILTMDHDSKPEHDMVKNMMYAYNSFSEDERTKIASILPSYVDEGLIGGKDCRQIKTKDQVSYVDGGITSGNMVKTSVFNKIGLFNEELFIDYVDFDICFRMIESKYKIIQVQNAILLHNLGNTDRKKLLGKNVQYSNHSFIRRYYITRNRLYVWKKYKHIVPGFIKKDKIDNAKEVVKIILFEDEKMKKLQMIIKGMKDFYSHKLGKIN